MGGFDLGERKKITRFCGEMVPFCAFSSWFLLILTDLEALKTLKNFRSRLRHSHVLLSYCDGVRAPKYVFLSASRYGIFEMLLP